MWSIIWYVPLQINFNRVPNLQNDVVLHTYSILPYLLPSFLAAQPTVSVCLERRCNQRTTCFGFSPISCIKLLSFSPCACASALSCARLSRSNYRGLSPHQSEPLHSTCLTHPTFAYRSAACQAVSHGMCPIFARVGLSMAVYTTVLPNLIRKLKQALRSV